MSLVTNVWHWRNKKTGAMGWQHHKPFGASSNPVYEWKWVEAEDPTNLHPTGMGFIDRCCAFEKRTMQGGCRNCGAPCL